MGQARSKSAMERLDFARCWSYCCLCFSSEDFDNTIANTYLNWIYFEQASQLSESVASALRFLPGTQRPVMIIIIIVISALSTEIASNITTASILFPVLDSVVSLNLAAEWYPNNLKVSVLNLLSMKNSWVQYRNYFSYEQRNPIFSFHSLTSVRKFGLLQVEFTDTKATVIDWQDFQAKFCHKYQASNMNPTLVWHPFEFETTEKRTFVHVKNENSLKWLTKNSSLTSWRIFQYRIASPIHDFQNFLQKFREITGE
jgi:hypothetical protein